MPVYYAVPSAESVGGAPISRVAETVDLSKEQKAFDNDPFVCGMSKKRFFVLLNGLAACFHLALAITTLAVTCNSDAKCQGPVVYTYQTDLKYKTATATSGFELVPHYSKNIENPIYLVALPLLFFGLSFIAHSTVVVLASCGDIYRDWLLTCQQPLRCAVPTTGSSRHAPASPRRRAAFSVSDRWRVSPCVRWVEYSGSASVMFIAIAYTAGIRDTSLMLALFVLMFCVMTYGWVCEMLAYRTAATDTSGDTWGKTLIRLFPNLLGYVPYVAAYYIVIEQYMRVTEKFKGPDAAEGQRMPAWVDWIVIGQCFVFSSFAIVSILQQIWSPRMYFVGEIIYVVLSFTSKGLLGLIMIFNVLRAGDFEEAFLPQDAR